MVVGFSMWIWGLVICDIQEVRLDDLVILSDFGPLESVTSSNFDMDNGDTIVII